jgi:signal transduction histidine kinase
VHKIVENHQGAIKVQSPPPGRPRGARLTIELPV